MSKDLIVILLTDNYLKNRIQRHRHNAQQHDRHDQPIHFKEVKGQKDKMTIIAERKWRKA